MLELELEPDPVLELEPLEELAEKLELDDIIDPQGMHTPPQSTPVSLPFCTPSLQVGVAHSMFAPHFLLMQSRFTLHILPLPQAMQAPPPQSTSVSVPFLVRSEQVGAWQTWPVQTSLRQSSSTRHG